MATLATTIPSSSSATAIIVPAKPKALHITYSQLRSHVSQFQKGLADVGIGPQAAVSIALPNSYEFIIAFLAASWHRAIAAPLNPAYKEEEFSFYIDDLKSALILVPKDAFKGNGAAIRAARKYNAAVAECYWNGQQVVLEMKDPGLLFGTAVQPIQRAEPDDTALVLHTSGTTGRPKAVCETLTEMVENIKDTYQLSSADRTLLVMPLFHVHGLLAGFLAPLFSNGSIIVPLRFSASDFWDNYIAYEANWYTAVPTIHQILLRSSPPREMPPIRFIRSCSSPLAPKVFHDLEKAFNAPVLEAYAMTEAAHQMTSNPLPPSKRIPGSVGIGQGMEVKILDGEGTEMVRNYEGEICIRGENVTKGYLNNPDANMSSYTRDGFFKTGDQGRQDGDGYIFITGRIKELINKGGEKISPVELDNVVAQHPAVSEAVTFAIADKIYGQDIGLAVVLNDAGEVNPNDLKNWIAQRVAKFKVPKEVYVTDVMPKTATGKIQRRTVANVMQNKQKPKAKL
ncbi:uncharacterized protein KY384_006949 [Bacidia gigantensis]|uniref:uncharacterized protein n=1 Tax=Bacidia gigantensis TaxID=2732470 RepID=UPI001D04425D|nr:uncharacterized protein KY384_006949 [Bacidia gigantensis]KAG8528033.1 hypothetical protein KY384_006949 [Bacidia gigantensis]